MNDELKIFALYQEMAEEQPQMKQYADGSKQWYLHGKLHRVDAPAIEWADGSKQWYLHGKLHRVDAPAIEHVDGSKEWYLHDKQFNDAESWAEALLKQRNEPHDDASVDAFLKTILKKNAEEAL